MSIRQQDVPKVVALIIGIVLIFGYIATRFVTLGTRPAAAAPRDPTSPDPVTPELATQGGGSVLADADAIDRAAQRPAVDPFRVTVAEHSSQGAPIPRTQPKSVWHASSPPSFPGSASGGFVPVHPDVEPVTIGVQGVIANHPSVAVITVSGKSRVVADGEPIGRGTRVWRVTSAGVVFRSGKRRVLVPIGKTRAFGSSSSLPVGSAVAVPVLPLP